MDYQLFFTGERRGRGETHLWSGTDFSNQFSWNQINPYSELQLNYNNSAVKVNIQLPINFYGIEYKNRLVEANCLLLNQWYI